MNAPTLRLLLTALAFGGVTVQAAIVGSDNASTNAYLANDSIANDTDPTNNTNGWVNGDDGFVTGAAALQPWVLATTGGTAGFFIGNSTNLSGGSGANINSSGNQAWGMFAAAASTLSAVRAFDAALSVGQTFSIDLAVNFRDGKKGIDLRDAGNVVLFNFNVGNLGGGDDYVVQNAATQNGSIGNTYSANTAFKVSFTQTAAGAGTWSIARSGGVTDLDSGTYTGTPTNIKLYVENTTGGSQNDLYANNASTIPEPGSLMLFAASLGGLAFIRRRRRA